MLCFVCIATRGAVGARVHPVAVLNAAFCMVDEDERGHREEAYSRSNRMTAL